MGDDTTAGTRVSAGGSAPGRVPLGGEAPTREELGSEAADTDALGGEVVGDAGATPVVMLHGFAQTHRCWGPLAASTARWAHVTLLDAPGHGASTHHAGVGVQGAAALLLASLSEPSFLVGYSMGGRVCLRAALDRPDLVRGLVLIGATPGIADPTQRGERRRADHELAARLEQVGVERFVAEWLAQPLFADLPRWARFEEERRRNTAAGLAASLRNCGTGSMEPMWTSLGDLRVPTQLVTGATDHKFAGVADDMARRLGGPTERVVVPGAGHAAHLEDPDTVAAALRAFAGQPPNASPTASSAP